MTAGLEIAYAPFVEPALSPVIPTEVTAGVEAGFGSLPPTPSLDMIDALDKIMAYGPEELSAASRGLEAASLGAVDTAWTGADIGAAQALIGGYEVPADVAAGLEIAYGAGPTSAESLMTTLGPALRIAGIIGAAASIGFTIASDKPDMQKGIESALDAASVAALWIPVYGWAVAAGAQAVKFILGFTGIWDEGESHEVQALRCR